MSCNRPGSCFELINERALAALSSVRTRYARPYLVGGNKMGVEVLEGGLTPIKAGRTEINSVEANFSWPQFYGNLSS